MSIVELEPDKWPMIAGLFRNYRRMRFHIDSVIEGYTKGWGTASSVLVNSKNAPQVVQIKIGTQIFHGGDATHPVAREMIQKLPKTASVPNWSEDFFGALVIPESESWRDLIIDIHGDNVVTQQRIEYSSEKLNIDHLRELQKQLPAGFQIRRFDMDLVCQLDVDLDRHGMAVYSIRDFLKFGVSFWVMKDDEMVAGATSSVVCNAGVEVDIGTNAEYRRMGLATAVGATFLVHCLEHGIIPHWSTMSNPRSDGLAEKLGFIRDDVYELLAPSA